MNTLRAVRHSGLLACVAALLAACGGTGGVEQNDTPSTQSTAGGSAVSQGQLALTVSISSGVSGAPAATASHAAGAIVEYSYTAESGYTDLQVTLDGASVPASGTVTMDRAHQLSATAIPLQSSVSPKLLVTIYTHTEDPNHPQTPDFMQDALAFRQYRSAIIEFAGRMQLAGIAWNFQSDWNFLNAVIEFEIDHPDATLLAATNGKNVVRYLSEDLGVEIDPHSHENNGYSYADVAYLVEQTGVTPAPVVGGHIYDPNEATYQDWPRFVDGVPCRKLACADWRAELLMGAGTPDHANDPVVSGMWQPASETDYFTPGSSGIASIGNWDHDIDSVAELADQVQSGALDTNLLWTFGMSFNHHELAQAGFQESTVQPIIDQLQQLQAAGRIETVNFLTALERWRNDYGQRPSVHRRESAAGARKYVSFSLNTQDFAYPELSAALVTRVLDLHDELDVPLDVFLTTWQVDLFEASYPALLQRLLTSPRVQLSYHVRAPKPYANNYDWRGIGALSHEDQVAMITDYETHGLDMVSGLPTAASGGFQKLKTLWGQAPRMCGSTWNEEVAEAASEVFSTLGCSMVIQHGRVVVPGEVRSGLLLKPEHVDLRLFEYVNQDGAAALDAALVQAQVAAGSTASFVGVKMHDNDYFATQSAWTYVYQDGGRRRPDWDPTRKPALLSASEQDAMWALYEQTVRHAAALRDQGSIEIVDAADLIEISRAAL